jgi:hypothetical protein
MLASMEPARAPERRPRIGGRVVERRFELRDEPLAKRSLYSELLAKRSLYNELCMRICMLRMGWSKVAFNQALYDEQTQARY